MKEIHAAIQPDAGGSFSSLYQKTASFVKSHRDGMIHQFVFTGSDLTPKEGRLALERACGGIDWPLTWLRAGGVSEKSLISTALLASPSDVPVRTIRLDGRVVGKTYSDEELDYCVLGGIHSADSGKPHGRQVEETFEMILSALDEAGMDFSDVVRTWFYLDHVWSWYGEFNKIRTEFFNSLKVFDHMVPASTGIGAANDSGTAIVRDILAVKPRKGGIRISAVDSPLQCSALKYKSSFSRAVEIETPTRRSLYVSGTASIAPGGETVHLGDAEKQIALTMEVAEALLASRGMEWSDTKRAIAYFKNPSDACLLDRYRHLRRLPEFPMVVVHSGICRENLLFEIELDAVNLGFKI